MADISTETEPKSSLHALDPDLPFLASEAAVDIEIMLSGGTADLTAVRALAERLSNSLQLPGSGTSARSLMDPATLTVLNTALQQTTKPGELNTLEDLVSYAANIAGLLPTSSPVENRNDLERSRDFCVALSRCSAAFRKSIRDLRPSHPFRR